MSFATKTCFFLFSNIFCDNFVAAIFCRARPRKVELLCRVRKDAGPVEVAQVGVAVVFPLTGFSGFHGSFGTPRCKKHKKRRPKKKKQHLKKQPGQVGLRLERTNGVLFEGKKNWSV